MDQDFEKSTEQAAAFQKIWVDSVSKMMQAAFTITPNSPPPEVLRQIRSGIFQALAGSWDEFMRSPQFLEGMKQWMESAINFRKISNDFMSKVRNEMQAPSRDDVDTLMVNIRHIEKRLLDRVDELANQVSELNQHLQARKNGRAAPKRKPPLRPAANRSRKGGSRTQKAGAV
jgi:hypothetical protein